MASEYTGTVVASGPKEYTGPVSTTPSGDTSGGDGDPGVGTSIATAAAPTLRGVSPYLAGAGAGALAGSAIPGVGTAAGAVAGAGAVGLADLGISMYNPVAGMLGLPKAPSAKELTDKALTAMGVPETTTGAGRMIESTAGGVVSALTGAGAARQIGEHLAPGTAKEVMSSLAKGPGGQAVAGGTSAASSQAVAEAGGGPLAQLLASIFGGMAPGTVKSGAKRIVQGTSSEAQIQERAAQAKAAGVSPDVATVAPSMVSRAATKAMSGTETMQAHRDKVVTQIEAEANRIAATVGKATSENDAGRRIEAALGKSDGGFVKRAKAVEDTLWGKWWKTATGANAGGEMGTSNTLNYLRASLADSASAPALKELLKDEQLGKILAAFEKDMAPKPATPSTILGADGKPMVSTPAQPGKPTMPIELIKQLRTAIGEKMDPTNLSPGVSRNALKPLYAALSEDMEAYATTLGPKAQEEFLRANKFSRGMHNRIETYIQDTQGRKPYEVWRYATSPASVEGGGQQFLKLNQSMSKGEREVFHATFIKNMGLDRGGQFNPQKFVENYKSLSPMVKSAILPGQQGVAMKRLVSVIGSLEKGGMIGGSKDSTPYLGAYMLMGALLHAHPKALLTVAMASSKSEKLAQMLVDPKIIQHISGVNNIPADKAAVALQSLAQTLKTQQPDAYDQ